MAGLCALEEGLSRGVGRQDRQAGAGWESPPPQGSAGNILPPRPALLSAVSTYTNAFAITQFFGVLCAPWNGLLMDWLKQKYQKEVKDTGEAWAAGGQGPRRGGIFTQGQSHLLCS